MKIEFFFDFSCPYAYLGSTQIEQLAERHKADLIWKPMLLGGVFRSVATPMNLANSQSSEKNRHTARDMYRWAEKWHVPLSMPPTHPMRTVRALRTLLACQAGHWPALIKAFFEAYWVHGKDMDADETIRWALNTSGIAGDVALHAMAANENQAIKDELRQRTEEAIARDVFGAPTVFVSGEDLTDPLPFWGQDRLEMVEAVLAGWRPPAPAPVIQASEEAPATDATTLDFWYDFSSPFAYLGATQIEAVARRCGATLRWRPLLLGALFKSVGTPNVPLLAMSEAKRQYQGRELAYWAAHWNVPFQFCSTFPLRTVTPLRLALLADERIGELTALLFKAAWVDGIDIGNSEALVPLLRDSFFGGDESLATAMLDACKAPAVKALLRTNTEEAQSLGVFGVPTSIVTRRSAGRETSELYWGQDRLSLLEEATISSR